MSYGKEIWGKYNLCAGTKMAQTLYNNGNILTMDKSTSRADPVLVEDREVARRKRKSS